MINNYRLNEIIDWILPLLAFVIGCLVSNDSLLIGYLIIFIAPIYTLCLSIHLRHFRKGIGTVLIIYSWIFIIIAICSLLGLMG